MSIMHGFLNIDKPAGMTSHDVVARIRRIMGTRQVGHAGTLDPAATGVLVVALGAATRLIEYVQDETSKRYLALVRLGVTTETDDAEGAITATAEVPELNYGQLQDTLKAFTGQIMQIPPMYSALHHQGQRLHELARAGVQVELAPRQVQVDKIEVVEFTPPLLALDISCGKGTYIRSLARDIGNQLGCGGSLAALQRTAVGAFQIAQAFTLDSLPQPLLPPEVAVADWPAVTLAEAEVRLVRNGMPIELADTASERVRAHQADGSLLALLVYRDKRWHPHKVFNWT
jgi:tRNA pseudouridine55 synthase